MSHQRATLTAFSVADDNLYIPTQNKPLEAKFKAFLGVPHSKVNTMSHDVALN